MSDGSRTLAPLVASLLVIAMTPNTLRAQSADEAATKFIAAYESNLPACATRCGSSSGVRATPTPRLEPWLSGLAISG